MYENKEQVLREVFGHSEFREGQGAVIDSLTAGRDVLAIMPTGGGKSVCYQIPALLYSGITLVISPLISLMKDQVMALNQSGVRAAYINSSLTMGQYYKALANIRAGVYKIIYVAPERLETDGFLEVCSSLDISLVAVDEAHCVSGWGHDFRPAYLTIPHFISLLPRRPVVGAFTATATEAVKEDIARLLELREPFITTTGFDRPNLRFEVIPTTKSTKFQETLSLLKDRFDGKSGIIYCGTRSLVDEVSAMLRDSGINAGGYHAGMSDEARKKSQEDFIYDRCTVMVATNAFGMGIDKSNVSFVIHYNLPKDVESYYQEAGRAGRDGSHADCVLLASESDIVLNRFLIEKSYSESTNDPETSDRLFRNELKKLEIMADYARTTGCLREYLLNYFGESTSGGLCGNCSNCDGEMTTLDITTDAQKIMSCISRTEERFGVGTIAAVLKATMNENIEKYNLDALSTYGIMKGVSQQYIRAVVNELRIQGYLELDTSASYPIPHLNSKSREILLGKKQIFMREPIKKEKKEKERREVPESVTVSGGLMEQLKALRLSISRENSVPAYVIFSDKTIEDMCRVMPQNIEQFLTVSGVGKKKAELYGDAFIDIIRRFRPV